MKLKKILTLVCALCFLLGVGLTSTSALADAPMENEPLRIEYCNLSFRDNVCIKYMVNTTDTDVKLLLWTNPQENYTYGTQDYALETVGYKDIESQTYLVYDYTNLSAKQMTDDVYTRAYNVVTDEYSELNRYSILQYAYNKLGITGEKTTDTNLENMLVSMLEYGANAQNYFDYKEDRLATDTFFQVKTVGGRISDGSKKGLYKTGDSVTLVAPATDENDNDFSSWQNGNGENVSLTATYEIIVGVKNETYTAVYDASFFTINYVTSGRHTDASGNVTILELRSVGGSYTTTIRPSEQFSNLMQVECYLSGQASPASDYYLSNWYYLDGSNKVYVYKSGSLSFVAPTFDATAQNACMDGVLTLYPTIGCTWFGPY